MKTSKLFLLIFVLSLFAPAYAQKQLKYVPQAIKGTKTIPYVVNPKLPPAVRANFAMPVVRPVVPQARPTVAPAVESAVTAQVAAQTAPRVAVTLPSDLQKDFLTGPQALQTFRPGWKSELMLSGFTRQQLDLVEQAFKETDQALFELDAQGNWLKPRFAEWNYLAHYTKILTDNAYGELALNDGQIKTLFGKFSRLDDVFTRLNLQSFLLTHEGRAPNTNAPGEEGKLARHAKYNLDKRDGRKMNPEVEGYVYGTMPAKLKTPKPSYGPKGRAPKRTPEQIWEEVTQFIREHGRIPMRTASNDYERKLRMAWDNIYNRHQTSNDPYVVRLIKLHDEIVREKTDVRTPQEVLDDTLVFMQKHGGKLPLEHSQDDYEKSLCKALRWIYYQHKNDTPEELAQLEKPVQQIIKLLKENRREYTAQRTPQEILAQTKAFIQTNGRFPLQNAADETECSLRLAFDGACKKAELQGLTDDTNRELLALKEQWVTKYADMRTPQEVLTQIKAFIQTNGCFPSLYVADETERSLRHAFDGACKKAEVQGLTDDTSKELLALKEQWVNKYTDRKTPQEIFTQVKAFIQANGRFPLQDAEEETERSLRNAFDGACKRAELQGLTDDTSRKLLALKEQWVTKYTDMRTPQEVLTQVQAFIKENGRFPLQRAEDETERSLRMAFDKATKKAELQGLTDDTSRKLLALKEQWVTKYADMRTPQEVLTQVQAFIQVNGRFPLYAANETERSLRKAFDWATNKAEAQMLTDDTSRELLALKEKWVKKYKK